MTANPWVGYWDALPAGRLLFPPEAEHFAARLLAAVPFDPPPRVLDFGCGYGHVAARLATAAREVEYWDAAPSMRAAAANLLDELPNCRPWDGTAGGFDLIVVNSVVQYMTADELRTRLVEWAALLAPGGRLVVADLIPVGHRVASDMLSLALFGLRRGYLLSALRNTLAERSRYDAVAAARPLFHIDPAAFEADAGRAGLTVRWTARNLTHFRGRRTAILAREDRT